MGFWHPWLVSNRRRFSRSPTGSRKTVNSPTTEARGIRLRGEHGISRQTIAQGRPDALRWTCMLVCALLCAYCTRDRGRSAHRSAGAMNHCAGKAGCSPLDLYARVRTSLCHCTRDRGCSAHPVFPAPSLGESFGQASGASRREIANAYSVVIVRLVRKRLGDSSIPETAVIESIGRGVLDAPPARGMTVLRAATFRIASGIRGRKMIEPK